MYRERLLFTQQRLLRSELFTLKGLGNAAPGRSGANKDNAVHEVIMIMVSEICIFHIASFVISSLHSTSYSFELIPSNTIHSPVVVD